MAHLEPRRKRTLALQVALDRAGFSPGAIDAQSGGNTERALRGFQQANSLRVTGELDRGTVRSLGQPFQRPIRTYRITANDIEESQTYAPIELMLAERFHTTAELLHFLNTDLQFEEGETVIVPNVDVDQPEQLSSRKRPETPVVVTVAERAHMLKVQDASGDVIFHAPVTSAGDRHAMQVEPSCLPRVSVGGIRLTSWDAMRLASLMDGNATVIMR